MNRIIKTWTSATKFLGEWKSPVFVFFSLTLLVVFPLFIKPGFVFLLDWAPVSQPPTSQWGIADNYVIFNFVWWFLHFLLPGGFLQKALLFLSLFLAGLGMVRLGVTLRTYGVSTWGGYFGGIFYMFNPFVYSRALTGQWNIITAYALLPWLLVSLLYFLKRPAFFSACRVALWCTAIILLNIHVGLLAFLLLLGVSVFTAMFSFVQSWRRGIQFGGWLVVIFLIFLALNSYWIGPAIAEKSAVKHFTQQVISQTDIFSFFTRPDPVHGVLWNTAAMYGFWADEDQRYVLQKIFVLYWLYLFFAFFALVLWGAMVSLRNCFRHNAFFRHSEESQWGVVLPLILTGLVAFFFAVGVSYEPIKPTILWLYNHIPFLRGFREPHKFVALLVFIYAIFGAIGVNDLLARIERIKNSKLLWFKLLAPGLFLLIPLAYSPGLLWGFHGQIKPSHYPKSWFQVDEWLASDSDEFRVLFLPWHQYINLSFANNQVIANPAEQFFHKPTIAGDNMEFGPIYTQSTRPESRYIEGEILAKRKELTNMGEKLLLLNVKYVIFAQESDFFNYTFIEKQKDLVLVFKQDKMKVFRNTAWSKRSSERDTL